MARRKIDPLAFAKAWQLAGCVKEVAERMGMSYSAACQYATRLRARGAKLKSFRSSIDVDEINALIEEVS